MRGRRRKDPDRPKPVIDRKWFDARLAALDITQLDVAIAANRSAATITKALKGERNLDAQDVASFASALRVSSDEILFRLGLPITAGKLRVAGAVLGDGRISTISARVGQYMPVPSAPPGAEVVIAETEGPSALSLASPYAGAAFVFVRSSQEQPVPPDTFGRLCVIEAEGQTLPLLATMGRAKERSKMALEIFQTNEKIVTPNVLRASAIIQIIFP